MEVKAKGVSIKFRLPTVPEKFRLLSKMGVTPENSDMQLDFETMALVMENIDGLIESVSVKHEGGVLSSWEELLQVDEMTGHIVEVVATILHPPEKKSVKKP